MNEEDKKALIAQVREEQNQQLWEAYHKGPERLRLKLQNDVVHQFEHKTEEWIARMKELGPRVTNMTVDEARQCLHRPTAPDWWNDWEKFRNEVALACLPYLRREELVDGAVYRISCRNSDCGVWREEEKGFEIPRYKWGSSYLFVEYHWDNGPPFGTSKPWERLPDLPAEAVEDAEMRLRYLQWVQAEVYAENRIRYDKNLSMWDPIPKEEK